MTILRKLQTNFSKGVLSPRLAKRSDLASYFDGAEEIENFVLLRQGGLDRRVGTRFVAEVKDSTKDTILLPFEISIDESFVVELGEAYTRFFKDKKPVLLGPSLAPVEVETPYVEAHLRNIHFTQSVDVLFLFQPLLRQRRLSHVDDLTWSLAPITYNPPPSFEADVDISQGIGNVGLIKIIIPVPGIVSGTISIIAVVNNNVSAASVQFKKDGADFGPLLHAPPWEIFWDTTTSPDGTVATLTAVLTDVLNIETTSAQVVVTVQNPAPPPPGE